MTGARRNQRRLLAAPDGIGVSGLGVDCYDLVSDLAGPLVVVLGGVHGDEPEGVLAAGRLAAADLPLTRGGLRVVPVCNEEAFAAGSRATPSDGVNLARVFPGNPDGSATERIADVLTRRVLAEADLLIDLHTAGRHFDMPLMVGCLADGSEAAQRSRAAARAFGVNTVWMHPRYGVGRASQPLQDAGRPAIYAEAPGGEAVDPRVVSAYVAGVHGVLRHLGMLDAATGAACTSPPCLVTGGGDLDNDVQRFAAGGMFAPAVVAGEVVAAEQPLGIVYGLHGEVVQEVRAAHAGPVMFLRRSARVRAGEVIACIATTASPADALMWRTSAGRRDVGR